MVNVLWFFFCRFVLSLRRCSSATQGEFSCSTSQSRSCSSHQWRSWAVLSYRPTQESCDKNGCTVGPHHVENKNGNLEDLTWICRGIKNDWFLVQHSKMNFSRFLFECYKNFLDGLGSPCFLSGPPLLWTWQLNRPSTPYILLASRATPRDDRAAFLYLPFCAQSS